MGWVDSMEQKSIDQRLKETFEELRSHNVFGTMISGGFVGAILGSVALTGGAIAPAFVGLGIGGIAGAILGREVGNKITDKQEKVFDEKLSNLNWQQRDSFKEESIRALCNTMYENMNPDKNIKPKTQEIKM